jgi:hypothetical protein
MRIHHHAPFKLRVSVSLRRAKLDREIAAGWPCESTAAHVMRARQLVDPGTRRKIARCLRGTVDYVDRCGSGPIISAVVIDRAAVRSGREPLLGLAERLERGAPVSPRGVAQVLILLTDGIESPLFNPQCGQTVIDAIWKAADLLGADAPALGFDAVPFQI